MKKRVGNKKRMDVKALFRFFQPLRLFVFFVFICSNCSLFTKETDDDPCLSADCFVSSFSENYLKNFKEKNVYFNQIKF